MNKEICKKCEMECQIRAVGYDVPKFNGKLTSDYDFYFFCQCGMISRIDEEHKDSVLFDYNSRKNSKEFSALEHIKPEKDCLYYPEQLINGLNK